MCRSRGWFLRLEPVAADVEEAPVGPVTRRQEEDDEQKGAVDAWSVEEVCADEEDENEGGRRVGRYEEQWEPTPKTEHFLLIELLHKGNWTGGVTVRMWGNE